MGFIYAPINVFLIFFFFFPPFLGGYVVLLWNWSTELPKTRGRTCLAFFSCKRGGQRGGGNIFGPNTGGRRFLLPLFWGDLRVFCFFYVFGGVGRPKKSSRSRKKFKTQKKQAKKTNKNKKKKEKPEEKQKQEPAEEENQGFPSCFSLSLSLYLSIPSSASLSWKQKKEEK